MKIERIEDKKFLITINEKEASRISDQDQIDFYDYKILVLRLGRILINFMMMCCQVPDLRTPPLEEEL